ncbi:MAG: RNA polymerase factor sigma-54 [Pseudomonadota bacterium]|nr:RNA polymerase factor sigma-54 [Pseudomonadota bacterium]
MHSFSQNFGTGQLQAQRQVLSPGMQRALHLLGLPQDELEREVAEICEANPLIAEQPLWLRRRAGSAHGFDQLAHVPVPRHLSDHLKDQLLLLGLDDASQALAHAIIDNLDERGFLDASDWREIDTASPDAEEVLRLVQELEPAGVGARSLAECFWLQLEPAKRSLPAWRLLLEHLQEMPRLACSELARLCGVSEDTLADMMARLRRLDPTPGLQFDPATPIEITPDLVLRDGADGEQIVELASRTGARLVLDGMYRSWKDEPAYDAASRQFLARAEEEVSWLRQALRQRGQTLLDVARLVVRRQYRFIADGDAHLAPLTMRVVAAELKVHESTVSRAVAHKHILTPRGVLPLRQFFSMAISGSQDADKAPSSHAVRAKIAELIRLETRPGGKSDAALASELADMGIVMARRSVAKHREQLGLGSARERSRWAGYQR